MRVLFSVPTSAGCGRKTVTSAGTAVVLAAAVTCQYIDITAETDNTDYVVFGDSSVVAALATRKGTPLAPGEKVRVQIASPALIYLDSVVNGEGVTYAYYN